MFTPRPIGFVKSPYTETSAIPKGLNAKHDAEGVLEILLEFEAGLKDVQGFSHLFVLWVFDRSEGFDLSARRRWIICRMASFLLVLRAARILSGSRLSNSFVATTAHSLFAGLTCSTARRSWTLSHICRVFPRRSCDAAGYLKRKQLGDRISGDDISEAALFRVGYRVLKAGCPERTHSFQDPFGLNLFPDTVFRRLVCS
jgi:hypothetical protein